MTALNGIQAKLERTIDVPCPDCGEAAVVIGSSAGPHVAGLRCICCDRHRGWLSKGAADFILAVIDQFGRPLAPIIVRDSQFVTASGAAATQISSAPTAKDTP